MADLLATGLSWLAGKRHEHMTRTIQYTRGVVTIEVLATKGRTTAAQEGDDGFLNETHAVDWIMRAEDLVLSGVLTEPARGDQIREDIGDETIVYEVLPVGGQPHFRRCNEESNSLRIHTQRVGRE